MDAEIPQWILDWGRALSWLIIPAAAGLLWAAHQVFATRKQVAEISQRLRDERERRQRIEDRLQRLPGSDDIHELHRAITELSGTLKAGDQRFAGIERRLDGLEAHLGRIDEYLRQAK